MLIRMIALSLGFLSLTIVPAEVFAKTISDHRVKSLSCQKITADSVAKAIRPDVFGQANHLPYTNWSFRWGIYHLANCWSLSRFQRLYFYLREPKAGVSLTEFADQARSHEMYEENNHWKGIPLNQFWFMPDKTDSRWAQWETGWYQRGWSQSIERGLTADIEYYQVLRFHDIDNLKYLSGPLERTVQENKATWSDLSKQIGGGRRPLMLLRPSLYNQHVVVGKRIERTPSGAKIWVYDSNAPWIERTVEWNSTTSMFTAIDVVTGLDDVLDPAAPLGLFIVDGEENEQLLNSLATHYKKVCAAMPLASVARAP